MKRILLSLVAIATISLSSFGQSPEGFKYQAVVRDAGNTILNNQAVGMQMTIQQGSIGGTTVYQETFAPTTNGYGLVNLEIGSGTVVSGDFTTIDWANGPYFMETAADLAGGTSYVVMGASELMSVPYALYAKTSGNELQNLSVSATGDTLYLQNGGFVIIPGISAANPQPPSYPSGSVFCASGASTIVDVTNPTTGAIWMDRNLGATQAATSSTDINSYGDLYQWGRRTDGHQCRTSPTTSTLSSTDQPAHGNFILAPFAPFDWRSPQNTNLWQGVNGINNPCPIGYRLPTETEIDAERLSWSQNNSAGAFASPLKLPMAGGRDGSNGSLSAVGTVGVYWSSTVSSTFSRHLYFSSGGANMSFAHRAGGFAVRCLKD